MFCAHTQKTCNSTEHEHAFILFPYFAIFFATGTCRNYTKSRNQNNNNKKEEDREQERKSFVTVLFFKLVVYVPDTF